MKLPALSKAVATTTSRSRRKKNKDDTPKPQEELEDIKPIAVCKKVDMPNINKLEKELVVDVETLSFKPAGTSDD